MLVAKRKCSRCGEIKSRSLFPAVLSNHQGIASHCKDCDRKRTKKYYDLNRDELLEKNRKIYWEKREERLERMRVWKKENKEWITQYARNNLSRANDYWRNRRSRVLSLPNDGYTREEIMERDDWKCQICFEKIWFVVTGRHRMGPQIDHIIPVTDPNCPGDIRSNVQLTHMKCNVSKGGFKK